MQEKVSILKLNDELQTKNKKLIDETQKLEKDFVNERIKNKNLEIKHRIEI
jgi:hypothetical protein